MEHGTAVVRSAVLEPAGFAFLGQEVFAEDFRGSTVVFRGEFRVQADTPGRAGLFLRVNEGHAITGLGYPGPGGGLWLRMIFPPGLRTWLVPSGWTVSVQPIWCSTTW